jgi:hypothetical protein
MAIKQETQVRVKIHLKSPQGNAFYLIGTAQSYAKQLGCTPEQTKAIINDMQSSDYDHLIDVFEREFGDYVDLIR